ncbi:MAG: LysR substrate-binding domain-containing protein [Rhodobacteraceae bacterium]|nr:LysR substrate-binding domain-containing protein [Paracoccaceae bacterium]
MISIRSVNFRTLDLNLLRVLDALLREGSTVRAARRVGLSQPAVSAALGRLRRALGDPLFLRHGQGLVPTDFARGLALPLREALERLEALLAGPEPFDPATARLGFKLAGSDFFAELLMPRLARRMLEVAPEVTVQLVDLVPESYIATLEREAVDLALIPRMAFPDWAEHRPLFRSDFVVIARSRHPRLDEAGLAAGGTIPLDLYCALGHVLFSPEGRRRGLGDAVLEAAGRTRRVAMTLPVFSGVCRAVAESELIALLPRQLALDAAPRLGLEVYAPPLPVPPATICMVWHRRSTLGPAHRWLREEVAALLAPLDQGDGPPRA